VNAHGFSGAMQILVLPVACACGDVEIIAVSLCHRRRLPGGSGTRCRPTYFFAWNSARRMIVPVDDPSRIRMV
jgi:hypothetical protein